MTTKWTYDKEESIHTTEIPEYTTAVRPIFFARNDEDTHAFNKLVGVCWTAFISLTVFLCLVSAPSNHA